MNSVLCFQCAALISEMIIKTWVLLVIIRGVDAVSNYAWKLFVLLTFFFSSSFLLSCRGTEDSSLFYSFSQLRFFLDYWFPTWRIVCLLTSVSFATNFRNLRDAICGVIELGIFWLKEKKSFPRGNFLMENQLFE